MGRGGLRTLKVSESSIERAIGDYLHLNGFCFYKQNTRGFFQCVQASRSGSKVLLGEFRKDANPYASTGLPDYVVIYRGFHKGLEVKTPSGKQQPNQIEFESYITKKGGASYSVVRSVDDVAREMFAFKAWVDRFYLKRGETELN